MIRLEKISNVLLRDKNITRAAFFWNAFSAVMNSFQTMVLLLVITRMGNMNDASIFVMAYAVGNLMIHIGKYGVRQFQVTDVREQYSLRDYVRARKLSLLLMMAAFGIYIGFCVITGRYGSRKAVVILLICFLKAIEAYEDVYHGRMQQKGRLDTAGRILGIRLAVFIAGFLGIYLWTENLVLTCLVNVVITLLMAIVMNGAVMGHFQSTETQTHRGLLRECLPLCLCMCLNMYIANAPKYTIDTVVSDEVQTCFNIVFMPVFIIALLANFLFQPFLKKMGEMWEERNLSSFVSYILRLTWIVVAMDVFVTVVGAAIGGKILGIIYGVDLKPYQWELVIFMIAGGVIAVQNLLIMIITTVRYQKYMIYGYVVTAVVMFIGGKVILQKYSLLWLCGFFALMLAALTAYCAELVVVAIQKEKAAGAAEGKGDSNENNEKRIVYHHQES